MQLEEKGVPIASLLQLYALTGCDTVSSLFRVGKIKAVGVIKKHPIHLTSSIVDFHDNYGPCLEFITRCYGMAPQVTMNQLRCIYWHKKTASAVKLIPPLKSLPPTEGAFIEHCKRALYQLAVWNTVDKPDPPDIHATDWGWQIKDGELIPVTSIQKQYAPNDLLKLLKCNCKANRDRCSTRRCSCMSNDLRCSKFCNCGADGVVCSRPPDGDDDTDDDNDGDGHYDDQDL